MKLTNYKHCILGTSICLILSGCGGGGSSPSPTPSPTSATKKFSAYYPSGCTLNNAAAHIIGTCTCIKDDDTGTIWTTAGNVEGSWNNWCNHDTGTAGYDANCPTSNNDLDAWNGSTQCGLTGGWHLPTAPNGQLGNLTSTNPGGDWSELYNLAVANSYPPGSVYSSGGDLSIWMNNNGFVNISNSETCIEHQDYQACPGFYISATVIPSDTTGVFFVGMNGASLGPSSVHDTDAILLVHNQ